MNYFNAISDNYFDSCLYSPNLFAYSIMETFRRVTQFDFIITLSLQILLLIPLLFTIYGFGIQQPLRIFYNKVRFGILLSLSIIGFSGALCSMTHLFLKLQPACLKWDQYQIYLISNSWNIPSIDNIITIVLSDAILSIKFGSISIKLIGVIIYIILDSYSTIITGKSSIIGNIISLSFGFWIIFFFKFIPIISIPIFNIILFIINSIFIIFNYLNISKNFKTTLDSYLLAFRSNLIIFISQILLFRFSNNQYDFTWLNTDWYSPLVLEDSDSDIQPEIPKMENSIKIIDFGKILFKDLIDSIFAFVLFLIGNFFLYFKYDFIFFY